MATTSSSLSAAGSVTLDLKGDNRAIFQISDLVLALKNYGILAAS